MKPSCLFLPPLKFHVFSIFLLLNELLLLLRQMLDTQAHSMAFADFLEAQNEEFVALMLLQKGRDFAERHRRSDPPVVASGPIKFWQELDGVR